MKKRSKTLCFFLLIALLNTRCCLAESDLSPFWENGLWGYRNAIGGTIIIPQWSKVESFRKNKTAAVCTNIDGIDYYGIIDIQGNYLVNPIWHLVIGGESGTYFCGEDGYYYISDENGLCGLYDIRYDRFYSPQWNTILFADSRDELNYILIGVETKDGILYGFLNSASGELAVDFSYCDLMPFSEERAIGVKCTDGVMRSVIIDYEGNEMFLSEGLSFAYVDGFHNGLCVVMDDSQLFGYVDIEGNLIIPCQYTNATSFDNQLAQVQYDGVWYNITSEGIISP